jgi:glucose-1-phosphate cytidylyltransferase
MVLGGTKTVILAGGKGTRLGDNYDKPKPLVRVGGHPLIYHVIKQYAKYGFSDFIIAAGYRADELWKYFNNENLPYKIEVIDTGLDTPTGGRVKKLEGLLRDTFMVTYADGISNVNIDQLFSFHKFNKRIGTVTAVHPPARFGQIEIGQDDSIISFAEKDNVEVGWVNGGFMVFEPTVFDYLKPDQELERYTMVWLKNNNQLTAYCHYGFWQCVDTQRDVEYLNDFLGK